MLCCSNYGDSTRNRVIYVHLPLPELYATPCRPFPAGIVGVTVATEVFITDTAISPKLVIYISPLPKSYTTPTGLVPTVMLPTTVLVEVFTRPRKGKQKDTDFVIT